MDRLFDRLSGSSALLPTPFGFGMLSPAVDIAEDDASFKVSAELPGLTAKDVEVQISGDTLTIKGEKRQEREEKEKNYHMSERSYGAFQRSFTLPDGLEADKITADFVDGVLKVTLPKSAKAKPTKIEVKAAT